MDSAVLFVIALSFFGCSTDAGSLSKLQQDNLNCLTEVSKFAKESLCLPRPTVVNISRAHKDGIHPTMAVVNRCAGSCTKAGFTCVNASHAEKRISVTSSVHGCSDRYIEEHTACACECELKCTEKQTLNKKECKCTCADRMKEKLCKRNSTKKWHHKECLCKCRNEIICSTGEDISQETCKCVK